MSMNRWIEFLAGLLFGLGLILAGMTDPGKVIGFLDLAGRWDPSLALVMGGAIAVGLLAFRLVRGRSHCLTGDPLHLPKAQRLDRALVLGSLTFGVGWGLAGFCPGPAIVSVASGEAKACVFAVAMLVGLLLAQRLQPRVAHVEGFND